MDSDPRYRTCCCHVKTCTIVIGVLEALGLISHLVNALTNNTSAQGVKYGTIAGVVLGTVVIILLFVGIFKERGGYLIPFMVFQVIAIIYTIVMIILLVTGVGAAAVATGYAENQKEKEQAGVLTGALIVLLVAFGISIIFQIWFFIVVFKCKRYFDEKFQGGYTGPPIQMVPTAPGVYKA